jgi:hypothetical protein
MGKHVASNCSVQPLSVEFENTRVNISHNHDLWMVAQLAVAYNSSLTAKQFKHEKDLYSKNYDRHDEQGVYAPPDRLEVGEPLGQIMCTQKTDWKTKRDKNKRKQVAAEGAQVPANHKSQQKASEWDEDLLGDRLVHDPLYEQHEELVPWKMPDNEELFGWYKHQKLACWSATRREQNRESPSGVQTSTS